MQYHAIVTLSRADLTDLAEKYAEMLRLRGASLPEATDLQDPMKAAMARLANEFPGSLRELDDFPLDLIASRRDALLLALAAESPANPVGVGVEPWMRACVAFHRFARGALAAKRWLGAHAKRPDKPGAADIDADTVEAFVAAAHELPFPEDALAWKDDLAALARPPRGRISHVVFERVATALGVSPAEARVLVFGPSRRAPRNEMAP